MPGQAPPTGFRSYLVQLGRTIVFPLLWMQSLRFADDLKEEDPQARSKVVGAILVSLVLTGGIGVLLYAGLPGVPGYIVPGYMDFQEGMYESLETRLGNAVGATGTESYQGHIDNVEAAYNNMEVMAKNLYGLVAEQGTAEQEQQANGTYQSYLGIVGTVHPTGGGGLVAEIRETTDVEGRAALVHEQTDRLQELASRLNDTAATVDATAATAFGWQHQNMTDAVHVALDEAAASADNHRLFLELQAIVAEEKGVSPLLGGPDAKRIRTAITASGVQADGMAESVDRAFSVLTDSRGDLDQVYLYLFLPGLAGVFFAPLVFAMGSTLKLAWEQSASVGFKPYPSRAMGWFLLLGGFGIPALFFAAWTFQDMHVRRLEGQIAL